MLNESVFYGCFYVLTKGIKTSPSYNEAIPNEELQLRSILINAFEDVFGKYLSDKYLSTVFMIVRGIDVKTSQPIIFETIVDLLLMTIISDYPLKQSIFNERNNILSIHSIASKYPSIDPSYFITLPMIGSDNEYLQQLIKAKSSSCSVEQNYAPIIHYILTSLSKTRYTPQSEFKIQVDFSLYFQSFNHSIIHSLSHYLTLYI